MNKKLIAPTDTQKHENTKNMLKNRQIFMEETRKGRALITGASSGLGEEYCWQLATKGHDLVIVARNEQKLFELAEKIKQTTNVQVEIIQADLSKNSDIEKIVTRLKNQENPIDLLVNNAGFALAQPFINGELDRELYALKVMVEAVLRLTHAAVESMTKRKRGGIINVASLTAFTAMGTYAAVKSWMKTFTQSLATETKEHNIFVSTVCPGLVKTNFHNHPHINGAKYPKIAWCEPKQVVEESLQALKRGKVIVVPTRKYKITYALLKFAPEQMVRKFAGHSSSSTQY